MGAFFNHLHLMATNPIGPETRNMSINVPNELHARISGLARESGMKLSAYLRALLNRAVDARTVFEVRQREQVAESASVSASTKAGRRGGRAK